jgi:hypothetical protein
MMAAEWEAKEGEDGEIIIKKKPPPSMPFRAVKTWIGGIAVFSLTAFVLVTLVGSWFG